MVMNLTNVMTSGWDILEGEQMEQGINVFFFALQERLSIGLQCTGQCTAVSREGEGLKGLVEG